MATARKNFLYLGVGGGDQRVTPITNDPAFEFDESDLWNSNDTFFPTDHNKKSIPPANAKWASRKPQIVKNRVDHQKPRFMAGTSLPKNVPDWSKILRDEYRNGRRENDDEVDHNVEDDDHGDDDYEDRLPPHEYLARTRIASFSVHEGMGRTLKGRDLRRVRNAIWKQTGFED